MPGIHSVTAAAAADIDPGPSRRSIGGGSAWLCTVVVCALWLVVGTAWPAMAQTPTQTRALLDLDDDASTGCTVTTADGDFDGVEQLLTTTIGASMVTAVERQECVNPGTDTFGAPIVVNMPVAPPWPVGTSLGTNGGDVVETYFPLPNGECQRIRLGFEVLGVLGNDALLSTDGTFAGAPIVVDCRSILEIPTLTPQLLVLLALGLGAAAMILLRRRRSAAGTLMVLLMATAAVGTAWAMVVLDGDPTDWDDLPAVQAIDPASDAPAGSDLFAAFALPDPAAGLLFLRTDQDGNVPPMAQPDAFNLLEDGAVAGDVLNDNGSGADDDPEGGALTVTGINGAPFTDGAPLVLPSGATLTPTAAGPFNYQAPADFSGVDTFDYTISDVGGATDSATVTLTITGVNDAPSFVAGADESVLEDSGAQTVPGWATAIDDGDGGSQSLTFNITGNTNAALFSSGPTVSPAGTLSYTPAADANGTATITVELMDDGGTANGGVDTSASQTFDITVNMVNDAPSFTVGADQTSAEDSGAQTVPGWATAIDDGDGGGQVLAFNVINNTNPGLFSAGPAVSSTGELSYTSAASISGTATITVELMDDGGTANGGVDTSASQSFVITVDSVNDGPSFTAGADETVIEDSGAQSVPGWATALDDGDGGGQTLTFNITGNTNPGLFSAGPAVSPSGELSYTPAADAFGTATITVELMDDGGTGGGGVDTSPSQNFSIDITGVNDPPSFSLAAASRSIDEDAGAQNVAGWALTISPGPANEAGQTVGFNVVGNTVPGLFSAGPALSSTGALSYTPSGTGVGSSVITVTLSDDGGTANGGVDTSPSQAFTLVIRDVPENRAYSAVGNTELVVFPAGTANPGSVVFTQDANSVTSSTPSLTVTGFGAGDPAAGDVNLFADGSMVYVPPVGFAGVDTFDYTVDTGRSATISITVADVVWYVDNFNDAQNPAGGDGRSNDPFDALTNAEAPSLSGHTIYVFEGDGSDTNHDVGFTLGAGERLLGQGVDLVVAAQTLFSGSLANRPAISHAAGGGVTATNADGAEIRGLEISGTTHAVQINANAGTSTVTVADNVLVGGSSHALDAQTSGAGELELVLGANLFESTVVAGVGLRAVNGGAGDLFLSALGNLIVDAASAGRGVLLDGVTFDADPSTGAIDAVTAGDLVVGEVADPIDLGGIEMNNVLGSVNFGTVSSFVANGVGLKIVGGGTPADFTISNTGGSVRATNGPGLDLDPLTVNLSFAEVSSTNSPGQSISLVDVNGSVVIGAGSLTGSTGTAFEVVRGTSDVTFGGSITNGAGLAVDIRDRGVNGDFVETTFGGTITSDGAGASGIRISGVTGDHRATFNGAVSLGQTTALGGTGLSVNHNGDVDSEALFTANPLSIRTNGADGIVASGGGLVGSGNVLQPLEISLNVTNGVGADVDNIDFAADFTGAAVTNAAGLGLSFNNSPGLKALAGVSVTTTGGPGIEVLAAGSVESTGATNTVASTNATALRVANAAITSTGLTFRSLASSGATEGVVLDNTGTDGGLTVTGTGAAASGGTISNITNNGIFLRQAESIDLAYMTLTNANTTDGGGVGTCDGVTNAGCRAAVKLDQISDLRIDNFAINGTEEVGINGVTVTNFDLSNTTIQNAGNALNEHGIYLRDLFGRSADGDINRFENVTVTGSNNHNIFITNTGATTTGVPASPDVVQFVGGSLRSLAAPNGANGLLFESRVNGNLRLEVSSSTFDANRGIGLNAQAGLGANLHVEVGTSSFVTTSGSQDVGLSIGATQDSVATFNVVGNTAFSSTNSHHVNVIAFDTAQITGTVANNANMNGSANGSGVRAVFEGDSQGVLLIENNTIGGHDFGRGIDLQSRAGGGSLDATVRGNTINPEGFSNHGVVAIAGNGDAGESNRVCVHYENNTSGGGAGRTGYFVEQFTGTTFQIQDYAGAAGSAPNVITHIQGENTAGGAAVSPAGFGVIVNYTASACATP